MTDQPNRLIHEVSLYLKQHAHNPVDWYPWGEEALERARREDKPILVSIGYSACHWCHVMERESFEDPKVAAFMNAHFVNIKVDREERPDVDRVYMDTCLVMNGQGGWPLNCFLTPDGRPFFAGTYFPPEPRYGRPSWLMVVQSIAKSFQTQRDDLEESAARLVANLERHDQRAEGDLPGPEIFAEAFARFDQRFDHQQGGFGAAPKFPNVTNLEATLRCGLRAGRGDEAVEMLTLALDAMALGGVYDHLGGGFHRYSTDARWLVPHFEKMLYDNTLLPRLYLEVHQRTGEPRFAEVAREVFRYLQREMFAPEGGFYATQDADSEGEEGRFFVWSRGELGEVLGEERARRFARVYDVSAEGNWEGHNILHLERPINAVAQEERLDPEALKQALTEDRAALFQAREARIKPGRDEKRITAWNGLAIQAFARGAAVLGEPVLADVASRCAGFIWERMWDGVGLKRIFAVGDDGADVIKIDGFIDDYAFVAHGLLDLHKACGDAAWLERAKALVDVVLGRFYDADSGELYQTPVGLDELPVRRTSFRDEAVPSAAGELCLTLLRLGAVTGEPRYGEVAEAIMRRAQGDLRKAPFAVPSLLNALDVATRGVGTIVVVGPEDDPRAAALLARARAVAGPEDNAAHRAGAAHGEVGRGRPDRLPLPGRGV